MNRKERILAAISGKEVDRVPVSSWMHFSEIDQDPTSLANMQIAFNEKYDYDFIKLMPFGTYSIQDWGAEIKFYAHKYHEPIIVSPGITEVADYEKLEILPAYYGTWGKQLQLAQKISKKIRKDTPFIQTIFSPMTTLKKLSGDRVLEDLKQHPESVKQALDVITKTTINFIKANIEVGVSGFFMATQTASAKVLNRDAFLEFCKPYDLQVIEAFAGQTFFNIIHAHGEDIFFKDIMDYSVECLNWHDRHTDPSLSEARKLTNKCLVGGIQEVPYFVDGVLQYDSIMAKSSEAELIKHCKEAINAVNGRGFILAPGCVVDPKTAEANLFAIRKAVE